MRDYEKLVKGLKYCFEHDDCGSRCPYFSPTTVCADERAKEAADAIEELLAAVPKWISVGADQKCPVTLTACAVGYFNGGKYDQLYWFDFFSTDKNGVIVPHNTDIEGRCIAAYTLPEPPKEETE